MFVIKRGSGVLGKLPLSKPIALFLFAHQDDEVGVFQKILDELRLGNRVVCSYFTDGVLNGKSSSRRNKESLAVLTQLGVKYDDIYFTGSLLSIPDASLPENAEKAIPWLFNWLGAFDSVTSIYLPAWEGGHHDHDALHAIGVMVTNTTGHLKMVKQFPLYNAHRCVAPFFRVFHPLNENGELEVSKMPWSNRVRFLRFALSYPSQLRTWIGLFPFVVLHYFFWGTQALQAVSLERVSLRPHTGLLYYENRNFYTWKKMKYFLSNSANIVASLKFHSIN